MSGWDASGGRGNTIPPDPLNGVQGSMTPGGFRAAPGNALPGVFPESGTRVRVRLGVGRYVQEFISGAPWCDAAGVWRVRCTGVGVVLLAQLRSDIPDVTDPCVRKVFDEAAG